MGIYSLMDIELRLAGCKEFCRWMVVMATRYDCTQYNWIVHLKMVKMINLLCMFEDKGKNLKTKSGLTVLVFLYK